MDKIKYNKLEDMDICEESDSTVSRCIKTSDGKIHSIPGSITGVSKINPELTNPSRKK